VSRFLMAHEHIVPFMLDVLENTQTEYNSEKANNTKYSKTKLARFSHLLRHSARKRGGLIL